VRLEVNVVTTTGAAVVDVRTTSELLVRTSLNVVASVTLKLLINPRTLSAAPSSTQPTLTPSVFSIGSAKHLEFFAHCSSTKVPFEHIPFAPLTQATCPVMQGDVLLRLAKRSL